MTCNIGILIPQRNKLGCQNKAQHGSRRVPYLYKIGALVMSTRVSSRQQKGLDTEGVDE